MKELSKEALKEVLDNQKDEIEAHLIYKALSRRTKNPENAKILSAIAEDEKGHYQFLKKYSGREVKPSQLRVAFIGLCARVLGLTFVLKLLELGEIAAQSQYSHLQYELPELSDIMEDEERHEKDLLSMLNEKRLGYMGSIVLGLNDALVELTGALAGFSFAIQNSRTIALMGLITGISASFSMAASEYLSKREEEEDNAGLSSLYTGIAYIFTVILLTLPFFLIASPFLALGVTVAIAVFIILMFNFYISVSKELNFKKRFFEMAAISIGVAALSFGIGWLVKTYLGFEI